MQMVIVALCAIVLLLLGAIVVLKKKGSRASRRRNIRAQEGERKAEKLLRSKGYSIEGRQVKEKSGLYVDGVWCEVEVRVDFIVRKRRKKFVAEVKTGKTAPDPTQASTRRQLLEYSLVFKKHGVLLIDMEEKKIREISF